MDTTFTFVPRKVAKSLKNETTKRTSGPSNHTPANQVNHSVSTVAPKDSNGKGKAKAPENASKSFTDEDYAALMCLALSNYSLWSDPDLRRKIEQQAENFIPLSYTLRHSAILKLSGLGKDMPAEETIIAKATRIHAADILEVRMLVSEPLWGWNEKNDLGGYQVRRKDWQSMLDHPARDLMRDDWEKRTVYLENIPLVYRSIPGIAKFTNSLVTKSLPISQTTVQNIILPPHHNDRPGDQPKCKGFALVILSNLEDVAVLLQSWPWDIRSTKSEEPSSEVTREAVKFGLRTMSKSRWEELKEEYLVYQQKLLKELVEFNDGPSEALPTQTIEPPDFEHNDTLQWLDDEPPTSLPVTTSASQYPLDCLIFVRNIHPETNKTTLKKLFCVALPKTSADGLDYVDFNKGMDSCYLRLASPRHTITLREHFATYPISQDRGLDETGTRATGKPAIAMELVQGKKEELYWGKVPEKVRAQAVKRAVALQESPQDGTATTTHITATSLKPRKRKRDK